MWDEAAKGFKFNVGDLVCFATTAHNGADALRYVVVQRALFQCHGGIQRSYEVRGVFQSGEYSARRGVLETHTTHANEVELVAVPAEDKGEAQDRQINKLRNAAESLGKAWAASEPSEKKSDQQ